MGAWTGLIWLRRQAHVNSVMNIWGVHKIRSVFGLAEELLASQEGCYSMELAVDDSCSDEKPLTRLILT